MSRTTVVQCLGGKLKELPVSQVAYFEASDKLVDAHGIDGKVLVITDTIACLEAEFADLFVRTHRSVLVARRLLESVDYSAINSNGTVKLLGVDHPIKASRREVPKIRDILKELWPDDDRTAFL
ncbi:LytTR family DNA-binding domain-containing protein [Pseudomonas sp. NPDC078700]|uniref:LytTR family DNA-binding domain-containing protein n=1 Tax=Pseudomonas sp. NPDC078700 TaxID=3364424 RepID=UPI0037C634B0